MEEDFWGELLGELPIFELSNLHGFEVVLIVIKVKEYLGNTKTLRSPRFGQIWKHGAEAEFGLWTRNMYAVHK